MITPASKNQSYDFTQCLYMAYVQSLSPTLSGMTNQPIVKNIIFAFDTAIVRTTRQQERLLPNTRVMSFIRRDIHDTPY